MQEFQKIKELNNKSILHNGFKFKINLEETSKDKNLFSLKITLETRVNRLFPHLEPKNIICYDEIYLRYCSTLKEIENAIKTTKKIIETWGSDENIDEINSEMNRYHPISTYDSEKFYVDIESLLKMTILDKKIHPSFRVEKFATFINKCLKGETAKKIFFFKIDALKIINLGYIFEDELYNYFNNNYMKKEEGFALFVILSKSGKTRSVFYIDTKKNKFGYVIDNSYATKENSRVENNTFLNNKKILVIGIGAIGSHTIELLASLWPDTIHFIDGDTVERGSSIRQNYNPEFLNSFPKVSVMFYMLKKYSSVKLIPEFGKFPDIIKQQENYDYIFDFTGEGLILKHFSFIKEKWPETTVVSSYIMNNKAHVKIMKIEKIENNIGLENNFFVKYDIEQNRISEANDLVMKTIKGCDPILEYSYVNVYKASILVIETLKEYELNNNENTVIKSN